METVKEAKQRQIFIINHEGEIEETNLYDFVMESAEQTTSPRGCEKKLHKRYNAVDDKHEVWTWGIRGQFPKLIESFTTPEEAEDYIFKLTYQWDFTTDDQRNTDFYDSYQEAEEAISEFTV